MQTVCDDDEDLPCISTLRAVWRAGLPSPDFVLDSEVVAGGHLGSLVCIVLMSALVVSISTSQGTSVRQDSRSAETFKQSRQQTAVPVARSPDLGLGIYNASGGEGAFSSESVNCLFSVCRRHCHLR